MIPDVNQNYTNQNFVHFLAQNVPWIASNINSAPLAKMDDGKSDVTIISNGTGGGRIALTRYLLDSETGDFFNANGQLRENLHMHYLKTN